MSPHTFSIVEPQEATAIDLLTAEDSPTLAPQSPPRENMEVDSRPTSTQHANHYHEPSIQHQPLQYVDANKQTLPPPSSVRSPLGSTQLNSIPQKVPISSIPPSPPAVKPTVEIQHAVPPLSRETTVGGVLLLREPPVNTSQPRSSRDLHHAISNQYPRSPREIGLDAIERLQTQISQNSGALAAHTRDIRRGEESFQQLEETLRREFQGQIIRQNGDIRRVDEAIARLHLEIQSIHQMMEGLTRELHATRVEQQSRGSTVPPVQTINVQDSALELMAQQIAIMSQKVNEVDTLKITIEIMKNKIQRLEEGTNIAPFKLTPVTAHGSYSTHDATAHHPTDGAMVHLTPSESARPQPYTSFETPSSIITSELSQRPVPVPTQGSGWTSVNTGIKRVHQNSVDSTRDTNVNTTGSPKRQRLGTAEPHAPYAASPDHVEPREVEPSSQGRSHTLASQHHVADSALASQSQYSAYPRFGTQDGLSNDSWRTESQHIAEHRPRGRPRGAGAGSRGGRGRKSMPAQIHTHGTPEWEKDDWQGVLESQASPDGYYNNIAHSSRGISHRGSGGGGRGGHSSSDRAVSLGLPGFSSSMSVGSPGDPYAHTKKTRTKPIRNADGVLIRKDGRPDMRSQSSAANLRKVHARKDGDPIQSPSGFTPTNLQHSVSADARDTLSPSGGATEMEEESSVHKKHSMIMGKMFPSGVDESRKQHDYTRQVFADDGELAVQPRAQGHLATIGRSSHHIKTEHKEQDLQDEDIDMDRTEDHADDEAQTPDEQSDHYVRNYNEEQAPE